MSADLSYAALCDQVLEIVESLSGETATPESHLKDDLLLESMDLIQLVLRLNEHFKLTLPSRDITPQHFGRVSQVIALVARYLETEAP